MSVNKAAWVGLLAAVAGIGGAVARGTSGSRAVSPEVARRREIRADLDRLNKEATEETAAVHASHRGRKIPSKAWKRKEAIEAEMRPLYAEEKTLMKFERGEDEEGEPWTSRIPERREVARAARQGRAATIEASDRWYSAGNERARAQEGGGPPKILDPHRDRDGMTRWLQEETEARDVAETLTSKRAWMEYVSDLDAEWTNPWELERALGRLDPLKTLAHRWYEMGKAASFDEKMRDLVERAYREDLSAPMVRKFLSLKREHGRGHRGMS